LPISESLTLATYDEADFEEFEENDYLSTTKGCIHQSSFILLNENQSLTLFFESDCPINYLSSYPDNPKKEICISFLDHGLTSEYPSFFNNGQATHLVATATKDTSYIRFFVWNHDSDDSHYLQYTIVDGIQDPPSDWIPSSPAPIALDRSPNDPEVMQYYITPEDPEIQEAVDYILSGYWRWAHSDWNALREWVVNHISYRYDTDVYGIADYWQLPAETLDLGTGDCEDFAILLCTLLRAYGVPSDQVYVACGHSKSGGYGHCFLFEHWYWNSWRAVEPQEGVWLEWAFGDINPDDYDRFYCFNDQQY